MVKMAEQLETAGAEELINEWNRLIREQDKENARQCKKKLDLLIPNMRDPLLSITYHMLQIRFYLLFKDTSRVLDGFNAVGSPRELPDNRLKYYYYFFNGLLLYDNKQYHEATESLLTAEPYLKELNDSRETAEFKYKLSVVYHKANYLLLSIYTVYDALKIFQQLHHQKRCADCENVLAVNTKYIEQYKESEKHYRKAIKLAERVQDERRTGAYYKNLGELYAEQNLPESAINCLEKGYQLIAFGEYAGQKIRNLYLLAKEYLKTGQLEKACQWLEQGLPLSIENGNEEYIHHFQMLKAKYGLGNLDFEETYQKGVHYFAEEELWDYTIQYSEELAADLQEKELHKEANQYYALAIHAKKIIQKRGALIS